jgi:hypothetical protein
MDKRAPEHQSNIKKAGGGGREGKVKGRPDVRPMASHGESKYGSRTPTWLRTRTAAPQDDSKSANFTSPKKEKRKNKEKNKMLAVCMHA